MDNHDYYTSKFYGPGDIANRLWIDLTNVTGVIEDLAHNISDRYRFFAVSTKLMHTSNTAHKNPSLSCNVMGTYMCDIVLVSIQVTYTCYRRAGSFTRRKFLPILPPALVSRLIFFSPTLMIAYRIVNNKFHKIFLQYKGS